MCIRVQWNHSDLSGYAPEGGVRGRGMLEKRGWGRLRGAQLDLESILRAIWDFFMVGWMVGKMG